MRILASALLFLILVNFSNAQIARVQFINNCPEPICDTVNVFVGTELFLTNLPFRSATPFMDVPAGETVVAFGESQLLNPWDAFSNFFITLEANQKYIITLDGIINSDDYNPAPALDIHVFQGAREAATDLAGVDINFLHGSTDAPVVDLAENELLLLTAIEDIAYGNYSGYFTLPAANYSFLVNASDGETSYGKFNAPLADIGLNGSAITILSSGFMSTILNQNGPTFGLWAALADGGPLIKFDTPDGELQLVHNVADLAAEVVDIYANGILIADDLAFRNATGYLRIPAIVETDIALAPADSEDAENALVTIENVVIPNNAHQIWGFTGIVSETGYNPSPALDVITIENPQDTSLEASTCATLFAHGATDLPLTINIQENSVLNSELVGNLAYNSSSEYLELPADQELILEIEGANEEGSFGLYSFHPNQWNLPGRAVTIWLSGFVSPNNNSEGPEFGLWMSLPEGGALIELGAYVVPVFSARAQWLHNSSDTNVPVDVYVNNVLAADNLGYREATPFNDIEAEIPLIIAVAPANSNSADDAIFSEEILLDENGSYTLVLSGILSETGYNPAPDFGIKIIEGALETGSLSTNTDMRFYNGCTDCGTVDIDEITIPNANLFTDTPYNASSSYSSLAANQDYGLELTDQSGNYVFGEYALNLNTQNLEGEAGVLFTTGFHYPVNNSNGPALELWMCLADGSTFPLEAFVGVDELPTGSLFAYPNPAAGQLNVVTTGLLNGMVEIQLLDATGRFVSGNTSAGSFRQISLEGIAPGTYTLLARHRDSTWSTLVVVRP